MNAADETPDDGSAGLAQRRVLVIGAGRSGAAVAHALRRRGTPVTVLETGTAPAVRAAVDDLAAAGAGVLLADDAVNLDAVDLIVPSPGVPEHHPLLVAALAARVPVWSEPELAWRLAGGRTRLVAVTGTNGKTTTTQMLAACLGAPAAGNIGTPLVTLLESDHAPSTVVAELSSFQLRFSHALRPHVAVLLNVAPDHLDWHGDLAAYRRAKARVWQRQRSGDTAVAGIDDEGVRRALEQHPPPAAVVGFTAAPPRPGQVGVEDGAIVANLDGSATRVVAVDELGVTGPHNVANACAAAAAALAAGAEPAALAAPLRDYRAGAHRLETIATLAGVRYVDDSKATNPHAAAAALASFSPGTVVWIAGGLGKGLEFSSLEPLVARHVKAAMTIGTSGPAIAAVARRAGAAVVEAGTLDVAVARAAEVASPGDTVLLAPACASMDQFVDYAERGAAFRAAVEQLSHHLPPQGAACGS